MLALHVPHRFARPFDGVPGRLVGGAAGLALLLAAVLPGPVWAHANLEQADPSPGSALEQAPKQLRLSFTEATDGSFSRVQVLNAKGEQVDHGDSRVAPDDPRALVVSLRDDLSPGVYTVAWRTLSAVDGHTVNGAYPLIVGAVQADGVGAVAPSSEANFAPETAVARWWFYLAASAVFGTLLAWMVAFSPALGRRHPLLPLAALRARRLASAALGALLVGMLYGALAQAASAADVPLWAGLGGPLVDLLTHGRYAMLWWPRLALVMLALGVLAKGGVQRQAGRVALLAAAGMLLTSSLGSHAAALSSGAYLAVAFDWLHLLGVAAWIGGLASLIFVLPTLGDGSGGTREQVRAAAIRRFSNLALVSVGVIVITGTFLAWLQVGAWEGLVQTAYGLSIVAKVALFALMLGLAAFNLRIVRRVPIVTAERLSAVSRRFASALRGELVLGVAILGVAAVLTGLSPAREELARLSSAVPQAGPVDRRVEAQGLSARVQLSPARVGMNRFAVELPGADPAGVERVQLTLTYLDRELGSQPLVLRPTSGSVPPTWQVDAPLLSQAGDWQAELLVRRTGQDDARSALRFKVTGPGTASASTAPGAVYPLLPSPLISLAYALIAVGSGWALVTLWRMRRRARRAWAPLASAVLVLACGGYVYAEEQRVGVPLDVASVRNPVTPDERSLAAGRATYQTRCAVCHGDSGRGDGPASASLDPPPADLRVHMAAGHSDGQLFYWVSYGFPGTAMPAWKDQLTEEERWDAINYIRTFANSGDAAPANP